MPTQLRLFSTNGSENFPRLEKEVNDWLTAKGESIQPVNSQTATCAIANGGGDKGSQAVVIALWYLDPAAHKIAQYPPEIAVDPAVLATYEGIYQMTPDFALAIRAEGTRLFVRATGQDEYELFAESENRFFLRIVDAQGTFLRNKDGVVDRLLWHQGGKYLYCLRVP